MTAVKLATITNTKTLTAVSNLISSTSALYKLIVGSIKQIAGDKKDKDSILEAELGPEDKREYTDLKNRLESLAEFAIDRHVCLLIDAEESELQPVKHEILATFSDSCPRQLTMSSYPRWRRPTRLVLGFGTRTSAISKTLRRDWTAIWISSSRKVSLLELNWSGAHTSNTREIWLNVRASR